MLLDGSTVGGAIDRVWQVPVVGKQVPLLLVAHTFGANARVG
jgi:hypothetical protein